MNVPPTFFQLSKTIADRIVLNLIFNKSDHIIIANILHTLT